MLQIDRTSMFEIFSYALSPAVASPIPFFFLGLLALDLFLHGFLVTINGISFGPMTLIALMKDGNVCSARPFLRGPPVDDKSLEGHLFVALATSGWSNDAVGLAMWYILFEGFLHLQLQLGATK